MLVLLLLGLGVGLLLALLGTSQQATEAVEGGLLLNTAQAEDVVVLELLAIEDDVLLVAAYTYSERLIHSKAIEVWSLHQQHAP